MAIYDQWHNSFANRGDIEIFDYTNDNTFREIKFKPLADGIFNACLLDTQLKQLVEHGIPFKTRFD